MIKEERILRREINGLIKYAFKSSPIIEGTRKGQFSQMVSDMREAVRADERLRNQCDCETCVKERSRGWT